MNASKLKFFNKKKKQCFTAAKLFIENIYPQSYLVLQAQKAKTYYEAWINYWEVRGWGVKTNGTCEHTQTVNRKKLRNIH